MDDGGKGERSALVYAFDTHLQHRVTALDIFFLHLPTSVTIVVLRDIPPSHGDLWTHSLALVGWSL